MNSENVVEKALRIRKMIAAGPDAADTVLWQQILTVCGQTNSSELSAIDFEACSRLVGDQVEEIIATQPIFDDLSFIYFGLYDTLETGGAAESARVGFYLAGGNEPDCDGAVDCGTLSYFPMKRRLHTDVLDRIREEGHKTSAPREVFDHLLLLSAAALLARSAVARLSVQIPTFVGFDSGDYFRVA